MARMDAYISPLTGDYAGTRTDTLANTVYLRLMTPLGSWWADKTIGSQLHLLQREKDVERVALLAQQYAEEALQPIIDDGRAERISVTAEQPHKGRLNLHIRVETATGGFDYRHGVAVV